MASRVAVPTLGDQYVAWIERHCYIPEGRDCGKPVRLRDWQKAIIKGIYDTPTRRAIISVGRKNGKSALGAMLLLLHLAGPASKPNTQLYSSAQSRDQASLIFGLASKIIRFSPELSRYITIRETAKTLTCPELGTIYRALSADASSNLGLSPVMVIHDEIGQVKGPRSAQFDALETASAAHDNPLSILISTQAPTDADLFSILIDDALTGADPRTKLFLWTCPPEVDQFSEDALRAANPGFGDLQSAVELRSLAADAKRMPSREAEYSNLCLNMRVEAVAPFISRTVWLENGGDVADSFTGHPVYCGLDLSETADLTAFVMIARIDDQWHVKPIFWLPAEGLAEKSRQDRVPFDLWAQQGHLHTTPGRAIEYQHVATLMHGLFQKHDIQGVAFDRYLMKHLAPWLEQAGLSAEQMAKFIDFGQGFVSMSPAIRELETLLLNGNLRHGNHPVLTMCAANAVVDQDPAGNRKLSKKRSRGRIDGMVSLAMAVSVATTAATREVKPVFRSIWDDDSFLTVVEGANGK